MSRKVLAALSGSVYLVWTTAALAIAYLARAASEDPPYSEEQRVLALALASWITSLLVVGGFLLLGRARPFIVLWAAQVVLLAVAFVHTREPDGTLVSPAIVTVGAIAESAGVVFLWTAASVRSGR